MAMHGQINSIWDWIHVLRPSMLLHLAPGVASTAAIWATMHKVRHPLALPGVLIAIPALFHLVLLAGRWSLKDARDAGWLTQTPVRLTRWPMTALQRDQTTGLITRAANFFQLNFGHLPGLKHHGLKSRACRL